MKETHSTRRVTNKCLKVVVIKSEDGIPLLNILKRKDNIKMFFSETHCKIWVLVLLAQGKVLWLASGYDNEISDPIKGQDFEQLSD